MQHRTAVNRFFARKTEANVGFANAIVAKARLILTKAGQDPALSAAANRMHACALKVAAPTMTMLAVDANHQQTARRKAWLAFQRRLGKIEKSEDQLFANLCKAADEAELAAEQSSDREESANNEEAECAEDGELVVAAEQLSDTVLENSANNKGTMCRGWRACSCRHFWL